MNQVPRCDTHGGKSKWRWAAGWLFKAAGANRLGSGGGRYRDGQVGSRQVLPRISPFLALGAWILTIGWFGFQRDVGADIDGISGLVAVNSLMAMVAATLAALLVGQLRIRAFLQ